MCRILANTKCIAFADIPLEEHFSVPGVQLVDVPIVELVGVPVTEPVDVPSLHRNMLISNGGWRM